VRFLAPIVSIIATLLSGACSTAPPAGEAGKKKYFVEVGFTLKDGRVIDAEILRADAPELLQKSAVDSVRRIRTKPGHSGYTSKVIYCSAE
jgi:hypothetical protein